MPVKYPPRVTDYKNEICECGHYKSSHMQPSWYSSLWDSRKPKHCNNCMCPKFKYSKTEHNLFSDSKYLGTDWTIDEEKMREEQS